MVGHGTLKQKRLQTINQFKWYIICQWYKVNTDKHSATMNIQWCQKEKLINLMSKRACIASLPMCTMCVYLKKKGVIDYTNALFLWNVFNIYIYTLDGQLWYPFTCSSWCYTWNRPRTCTAPSDCTTSLSASTWCWDRAAQYWTSKFSLICY